MADKRILVIDDDMYIRNACVEYFRSENYEAAAAESGMRGLELMQAGAFDVVITDFKMPEMDGLELLKQIKEKYPKTDVIMITAHGTIENAVRAMKLGAYDYVSKTFDIAELDLIVKRCFEKRRLSAEISELKELVNLYEVSKAISSIMGLDELLNLILKLTCDTLNADSGSIMLYDPKTDELSVKVAIGERQEAVLNRKIILGERIAGYAAKENKPLTLQGDLSNDPRFSGLTLFENVKSAMTVPLIRKSKLLGVLNLSRRQKETEFTKHDLNLLSIFAVEAAIAIENTYLFNSLEREKEELNATFSAMADGAIVTDGQLNIVRLNDAAKELLGLLGEECTGKNLAGLVPDYEPTIPWEELKKRPERTVNFELVRRKNKFLFLGALAAKTFDQENILIGQILVLRDITEMKREEKQKMDFLSIMSHKLRTPLTSINGFSSLLLKKAVNLDDTVKHALATIEKEGNLLTLLVDKLLRFTLLESAYTEVHMEKTSISSVIKRSIDGLAAFIEKNQANIIIDPELSNLPCLHIDSMKIIEVIENLIENAVKFNSSKIKTVKLSGRPWDGDDKFVVIEVADNGSGMPSEELKKIFKRFYQIDEDKTGQIEGVGLGLAVVKKITELHGGNVWVQSKPGEGSKFNITLPVWHAG